ncbi:MAG TPA: nucleoside permease [Steroidobacteraceae bacterium]|nr:nucleoside permease [Steroidobacteraceae bacterium]
MSSALRFRLGAMMLLQFFIWGGWFVTMGSYLAANLGATGSQTALAYSTQSWGAIIAPFVIGLIADKYFNAERLLGIIHLIGAALLYLLSMAQSFADFYPYLLAYMILYMPTLALVNAICFRQMDDPSRHFSKIRLWGTVGWIIAGLIISYLFSWDAPAALARGMLRYTFTMCAAASLVLGLFSFTLPKTPPRVRPGERVTLRDMLGLDALALLTDRNFLVFFIASILICVPLAFYYQYANLFLTEIHLANATGKQTLGQMSEVLFMLLIPLFLLRVGMKGTLLVGMLAWALRYVLFAYGNPGNLVWMLLLGIALHGVCYDFFFVSGQIYTDSKAGERCKSAAQGMITLATYGVGMLVGFWAAGQIASHYGGPGARDWTAIWLFPALFAIVVFLLFTAMFRNEKAAYRGTAPNLS